MNTLLRNASLLLLKEQDWINGNLLIKDGKIASVGEFDIRNLEINDVIDLNGKLVMPGMINAHSHSYTGLLKGTVDNVPLDLYMLLAIAGGAYRSTDEIYASTMINALQMLKFGTTAIIDHFSQRPYQVIEGINAAAQAYKDLGIRATIAPMFADKNYYETVPLLPGELPQNLRIKQGARSQTPEEFGEVCVEAIKGWHSRDGILRIMMGTDGPQRCSEKLLKITKDIEENYEVGWHTHILEAKTQAVMANKLYGKGLIEYLDQLGMVNERTSFAHFIWVSEKETEITKERRANIIHCPSTALHLGSGVTPIDLLLRNGLKVAIGTDGGNCGNLSMFEKVRLTALLHRVGQPDYQQWISAKDALRIALEGGARAMLLKDSIGSIEVGKDADLSIINLKNVLWQPINDIVNQLVFGENGSSVETIYVKGRKIFDKGKSLLVDEENIVARAMAAVERLKKDNREAFELAKKQIPYFRNMYLRTVNEDLGYNRYTRPLL